MKKTIKDSVCRAWLKNPTKNTVEKDGKIFYFCSPRCKSMFEKNPDKYVNLKG